MPDRWLSLYAGNGLLADLEPYLDKLGAHRATSTTAPWTSAARRRQDRYMLPYGFYLRAMFYNKELFKQAGVEAAAEDPRRVPRRRGEGVGPPRQVRLLPARRSRRPQRLGDVPATMAGDNTFFTQDGKSTFDSEGWVKGLTWYIDLYKNGLAPKDSVNWGFNEIVAGFYSGTCAMLDQDPDALIAIAERMKPEQYGVTTFPKGPDGKAFPTIGYAGWSMIANRARTRTSPGSSSPRSRAPKATSPGTRGPAPCRSEVGRERSLLPERAVQGMVRGARRPGRRPDDHADLARGVRLLHGLPGHHDRPAGAARRDHARRSWPKQWADYLTKAQEKYLSK